MNKRLLTVEEAAEYLGTTTGTLYQKVHKRMIPFVKNGRSLRFDKVKLDQLIDKGTQEPHGTSL